MINAINNILIHLFNSTATRVLIPNMSGVYAVTLIEIQWANMLSFVLVFYFCVYIVLLWRYVLRLFYDC